MFAGLAVGLFSPSLLTMAQTAPAVAPVVAPMIGMAEVKAEADRVWDRLDANHDGRLDNADRDTRMLERFAMWDTNHDGVISKDEFLAVAHARKGHARWERPQGLDRPPAPLPGQPMDLRGEGHGRPGVAMVLVGTAMRLARKDGVIARATFDGALKSVFDEIDTNHDGMLGRAELRTASHRKYDHPHHRSWQHRPGDTEQKPHEPEMPPPAGGR